MRWELSWRADPRVRALADEHYNRQKKGSPQFVPPGRCLVLKTHEVDAFWVTSWPIAEYVLHEWAGAWICSAFRNEGCPECRAAKRGGCPHQRSSDLVREACAATKHYYGEPSPLGMVTFVDEDKVKAKRDPGRCFLRAGFKVCGRTKAGLLALQLLPEDFPPAEPDRGFQLSLLKEQP